MATIKKATSLLGVFWLLAGQPHFAQAAEEALMLLYEDEEIISLATGTRKPIHLAPSVASVISQDDIRHSGATTLDEVLELVPGLHVSLSSLNRLKPVYSIRGIHSAQNPHALFLMNGTPFVNTYSGAIPTLFRYPVSNIDHIEVIRGPGSAVHGADAFAGVVNIITKDAEGSSAGEAGARIGWFATQDVWVEDKRAAGDWSLRYSIAYRHTNGDDDRIIDSDRQTTFPLTTPASASNAPGPLDTRYEVLNTHLTAEKGHWMARLWDWRLMDAGVGAGGAQALDPEGKVDNGSTLLDIVHRNPDITEEWGSEARFSYYYLDEQNQMRLYPRGATVFGDLYADGMIGNPGGITQNTMFDFALYYRGFPNHQLRISTGAQYQDYHSNESKNFPPLPTGITTGTLTDVSDTDFVYMKNQYRYLWYVTAQDEIRLGPDWELTAGLRYDEYSDFGGTVNPRMALVWATDYNLTTKLLYGRAFRAPSFGELYSQNNPVLLGNEDLDPETIDTLEVVFDYRPAYDLQTNLNVYSYWVNDLIDYEIESGGTSKRAQNTKDQRGYGLELQADWKLSRTLKLSGNTAWQHAEDADSGDPVPDIPKQQLYLTAIWEFTPGWKLSPQLFWIAGRERAAGDSRADIDDYTLIDLTLRRRYFERRWEFAFSVRNLFDEEAREPSHYETFPVTLAPIPNDYPLPGRSLYAELHYSFK